MEWNVKNALSRNTEREHLNKILADIKKTIESKTATPTAPVVQSTVPVVAKPRDLTITLTGPVTGQGKGVTGISIATSLSEEVVMDAPKDGNFYWRFSGKWLPVPSTVLALNYIANDGFLSWNSDDRSFAAREIQGTLGQIVVADGDGINGNPTVALDEAILDLLPAPVPSLINADTASILPGMAVARIGAGYVRADRAMSDRWNVVGLYIGDTAVPPTEQLKPKVDGIVTLTALQWDTVLGTSGGLATGMTYFLGNDGALTVIPPSTDGEYNVAVGLAITSTELHIRDMRPVKL